MVAEEKGKKMNKVLELIKMTDEGFFDQYLSDASLEELADFMKEFPEFMEDEETDQMDKELFERIEAQIHKLEKKA